jgi:hypothetical protein
MRTTSALLTLALCAGCGSDADDTPTGSNAPRNIVSSPPTAPPHAGTPDADPSAPDAAAPEADAEPTHPPETLLAAVNTLGFTRSESPGVAPGFNLDDRVSDSSDASTCRKADFTSPEGEPGIDNQLATLVPLFEVVGIGAVEGLVQNSIKEGGLLIMLEAGDVNDRVDDPEITLHLRLGQGTPLLGTDGLLLSGQTFHAHEGAESSVIENARIEGGVLRGGPFEAVLPIVVFGVEYELPLHNAFLRADLTYDGSLENGIMGGEVIIEDIIAIATRANAADGSILPAVRGVLNGRGDLDPDEGGVCRRISGAFDFGGVSAFLY